MVQSSVVTTACPVVQSSVVTAARRGRLTTKKEVAIPELEPPRWFVIDLHYVNWGTVVFLLFSVEVVLLKQMRKKGFDNGCMECSYISKNISGSSLAANVLD